MLFILNIIVTNKLRNVFRVCVIIRHYLFYICCKCLPILKIKEFTNMIFIYYFL